MGLYHGLPPEFIEVDNRDFEALLKVRDAEAGALRAELARRLSPEICDEIEAKRLEAERIVVQLEAELAKLRDEIVTLREMLYHAAGVTAPTPRVLGEETRHEEA